MNMIMRADTLVKNLDRYRPTDKCPWPLGRDYNVLLGEARERFPSDRYIEVADSLQQAEDNLCRLPGGEFADCGSVRTMTMRIQDAARAARRPREPH